MLINPYQKRIEYTRGESTLMVKNNGANTRGASARGANTRSRKFGGEYARSEYTRGEYTRSEYTRGEYTGNLNISLLLRTKDLKDSLVYSK